MADLLIQDYSKIFDNTVNNTRIAFDGLYIQIHANDQLQSNLLITGNVYVSYIDNTTNQLMNEVLSTNCTFISKVDKNVIYFSDSVKIIDIKIGTSIDTLNTHLPFDFPNISSSNNEFINIANTSNIWILVKKELFIEKYVQEYSMIITSYEINTI